MHNLLSYIDLQYFVPFRLCLRTFNFQIDFPINCFHYNKQQQKNAKRNPGRKKKVNDEQYRNG